MLTNEELGTMAENGPYIITGSAWEDLLAQAREAKLRELEKPGHVWVPKQWTSEMAHAGYEVYKHPDIQCAECGAIYQAMLSAAGEGEK